MTGARLAAIAAMLCITSATPGGAVGTVLWCSFGDGLSFYIAYERGNESARIGVRPGAGNMARVYTDKVTGARVLVEFLSDGSIPATLTTVLPNWSAWHSRHTISIDGKVWATQMHGSCKPNGS
jgi:hypothetical protein